jgi:hypothetical protein
MNQLDRTSSLAARSVRPLAANPANDLHSVRTRNRVLSARKSPPTHVEEALVVDERAELRPAQLIESKLSRMLKDASLPVSHLQTRAMLGSR